MITKGLQILRYLFGCRKKKSAKFGECMFAKNQIDQEAQPL